MTWKYTTKTFPELLDPDAPQFWKVNVHDPDRVSEQLYELQEWIDGLKEQLRSALPKASKLTAEGVLKALLGELEQ
jgi:hypothetical protein